MTEPPITAPDEHVPAGDLVLRRYRLDDAPALHEAIVASTEHLRPWMPWIAQEPLDVDERQELIRARFDTDWSDGTSFVYGIFLGDLVVGGGGLHPRIGPGGIEIGYWVRPSHTRQGIATAAAGALVGAAFQLPHITHVEIHHDRANPVSGRVPAALGFAFVDEAEAAVVAPGETGVNCRWRLERVGGPSGTTNHRTVGAWERERYLDI